MSKRVWGSIVESDVKEYGPESAGQKVGWVTAVENPDTESFYLLGAFATVGEQGGAVSIIEDKETGGRLWHDHLVKGLSRTCAYSILVSPGEDAQQTMHADRVMLNSRNASDMAGHSFHREFNVDDDSVLWGIGDAELTSAIQAKLEQYDASNQYARTYLTINGRGAHQLYPPFTDGSPQLSDITGVQVYDPEMETVVKDEMHKISALNSILNRWAMDGEIMGSSFEENEVEPQVFERFRQRVLGFHTRIEELRRSMTVPLVAYVPEGYARTWPYMSATDFKMEQEAVEKHNFGDAAYSVVNEANEVRKRQEFALRGAHILFALTAKGREQASTESNLLK